MASIPSYPARQLKRRRTEWMRRNATVVAVVVAGFAVIGVVLSLILLTVPMPVRLYALGFVHAGLIAALDCTS